MQTRWRCLRRVCDVSDKERTETRIDANWNRDMGKQDAEAIAPFEESLCFSSSNNHGTTERATIFSVFSQIDSP